MLRYASAAILRWWPHVGQTFRFWASRSRYKISPQPGHLSKTSAGRSRLSWALRGFFFLPEPRHATSYRSWATRTAIATADPGHQEERAAIAHEGQRDPSDRHDPNGHADIDKNVDDPGPEDTEQY